jgi:natural product biosynthesis luciferase-like monooxygenase protein
MSFSSSSARALSAIEKTCGKGERIAAGARSMPGIRARRGGVISIPIKEDDMDLSVMFFGSESMIEPAKKYDDILAIARAADELGFKAVWTPERHFQDFGQVFPNPSVLSAALAVATTRIEIRAGSIVLPLHHPLRVAEDWAVVDNLSHGRIGISMATGWHSKDFVLAPHNYADRRDRTLSDIDLLRKLWSGEPIEIPDGVGEMTSVRPQPTPARRELPLWLTTSGSSATWVAAGSRRMGILAAAASLDPAELAEKIRIYREAYDAAPPQQASGSQSIVTLMIHAYVGDSDDAVRERARVPLQSYLESYLRQVSSSKDAASQQASGGGQVDPRRMVEFAAERYLRGGALIGSPQRCLDTLSSIRELGVDELACFVDFGLDRDEVLRSLRLLAELRSKIA